MSFLHVHRCTRASVDRAHFVHRRDFLRGISAAGLAAGTLSWTDLVTAQADELRRRGMACILLWMQGGPSQFETFSPKPGHANGGETKAISTNVPGIQIAENFPEVAKVINHAAIIRSMTSREGSHPRATFLGLQLGAILFMALGIVVSGYASDRFDARRVLMTGCVLTVAAGALLGPMLSGSLLAIFAFLSLALFLMGLVYGPLGAWLPGLFPVRVRYTGASVAFNLGGIRFQPK